MGVFEKGLTRYPEKTKDEARALYATGLSYREVAKKLGISGMSLVRRWCDDSFRQKDNARALARFHGEKGSNT